MINSEETTSFNPLETRDIHLSIAEKIKFGEKKVGEISTQGPIEMEKIEVESQLQLPKIVELRNKNHLIQGLIDIQREAGFLLEDFKKAVDQIKEEIDLEVNPPIKKGETFSPEEEVQNVLKSPKAERKEKLREFKRKWKYQERGMGRLQETLIGSIRKNPDISILELFNTLENYSGKYGLTEEQKSIAGELLLRYKDKHENVRAARQSFPKDKDLYEYMFGVKPKGAVEVVEGPITLYFRCQSSEDYVLIHSQAFLGRKALKEEQFTAAMQTTGVSIPASRIPGLEETIIAENAVGSNFYYYSVSGISGKIRMHEEQHKINSPFVEFESKSALKEIDFALNHLREKVTTERRLSQIGRESSNEEHYLALKHYLRQKRRYIADRRAANEILAYFKEGHTADTTKEKLLRPREKGGIYYYLADEKERLISSWCLSLPGVRDQAFVEKIVSEVFEDEYHNLISKSCPAIYRLISAEGGYSKEQAIAILLNVPLSKWEKTVNRLLKKDTSGR